MRDVLLIHYSEIGTKGKNRSHFERRLREDVRARLVPRLLKDIRLQHGRFVGEPAAGFDPEAVKAGLAQVFGVAWYAFARAVPREFETIREACLAAGKARPDARTFKIFAKRVDKAFPHSSQDLCNRLGQAVAEACGLKVDLDHHDLAIHVDILPETALVYSEKHSGLRGMPGGSAGRMLCLFSGGIDSPVAAWMLMRRGAVVHLLHFHPFRSAEEVRGSKIFRLHETLRTYNPSSKLFLIPHFPYQVEAALKVPPESETVLFRRFMFRAAEALAARRRMKALVTGDCLGQVASQTLDNLAAAQTDLKIPVFAPLISYDKDDIVKIAKKIGTYEPSIQPYKDCCSLMSPHPKTNVSVEAARRLEEEIRLPALAAEALRLIEVWDGETLRPLPLEPSLQESPAG